MFLQGLRLSGVISFSQKVYCVNGLFFVTKKNDKQVMILDARPAIGTSGKCQWVKLCMPEAS